MICFCTDSLRRMNTKITIISKPWKKFVLLSDIIEQLLGNDFGFINDFISPN